MTSRSSLAVVLQFLVTNHISPYSLRNHTRRSIHHCIAVRAPTNHTASDKLFADAAQEEAGESSDTGSAKGRTSRLAQLESQHQNWTGEESMQDAILRMLIDKYKPGPIQTADEKPKELPPQVRSSSVFAQVTAPPLTHHPRRDIADAPLLPSIEGHRPWHTTFKAPSHATVSIKLGNFALPTVRPSAESDDGGERTKRTERELAKRKQQAHRLSEARESILDYRLGLRGRGTGDGHASRENPVSLKGWQSLTEDRIEKARRSGQFDKVEGRGQPIVRLSEERNPFITREEFLMYRIVQRNDAAPPWVEVQMELEASMNAFRETLRQSWTRRAIRTLTMTQPAPSLVPISLNTVASLRDREWEERERSYHDAAILELNSSVRKYNAMAPYAVRRAYYSREAELERAYRDCVEAIIRGLNERSQTALRSETKWSLDDGPQEVGTSVGLWYLFLRWVRGLSRRITKAS